MPRSLRKSCHACTHAKRRCQPQLPKCARCLKNGLECRYDLEPLGRSDSPIEPPSRVYAEEHNVAPSRPVYYIFHDVGAAQQAAIEAFKENSAVGTAAEIRITGSEEGLRWALSQFRDIPVLISQNKPSPFMHPQVYQDNGAAMDRLSSLLRLHEDILRGSPPDVVTPSRNVNLQRLIRTSFNDLTITDKVIAIQELTLYLIVYICYDLPSSYQSEAEQHMDLMINWARILLSTVPSQLSSALSPWEAWTVAESARRTIIGSFLVKGVLRVLRYGFCVYEPFLEALPFDPRPELWEALTEEEWLAAVESRGGESVHLVSFHEFIKKSDLSRIKNEGMFQKILLVGFYAKVALEALNG